ncbi:polar amino acid transport system substrate-binding protein [Methanomicrobium sp. W14]|uniref:ABC transporter substrate-binding protein n=1 Tax=Methanomicrobium sp. W14 TaxID=2817839 RepID=UPI001AE63153|nr:ABC transporter substrate-binding protein [Methanomicrobium sp. W14]MBP2133677.1 polar amino acid transport system substrate-binding protein [Methanomicrobium sp. W14]
MDKKFLAVLILGVIFAAAAFAGCTGTQNTPNSGNATIAGTENATGGTPAAGETPVYIVGIDGDYPPYSYINSDGSAEGFDVDSVKWIADKMGFAVKIKPLAWDGIIPALQAGKIDIVYSGMSITDERLEKVNFSEPYWTVNQAVAVKNGSSVTMDDIKEGKAVIGTQRGCTAAEWITTNLVDTGIMPSENLKLYENFPLAVTDLENGRIDAAMYDTPVVIESIQGKNAVKLGTIDTDEKYGVAIRKDDTELLYTMNEGLDKLMADPYWQELIDKYNLE